MMKRWAMLLVAAFMAVFLLGSCVQRQKEYEVEQNGLVYLVDEVESTISFSGQTYRYEMSDRGGTITFPDGAKFQWEKWENGRSGGMDTSGNQHSAEELTEMNSIAWQLIDVLENSGPGITLRISAHFPVSMFLFVVGFLGIAVPKAGWYLEYGWRFKNAEPSALALTVNRIGGGICILVAVVLLFA